MSHRTLATASAVVVCSAAIVAQASLMLDQQAPPTEPPAPFTIAVGGPVEQVVSQTVTVGIAGRLRAVEVPIGGCAGGTILLEIRDVNADGTPGPAVLSSATFAGADFAAPVTDEFRRLRIRGMTARFAVGDTFAISVSNIGGSCGIWPGPEGDPYSGGTGWLDASDGPIVPLSLGNNRDDMPFRTFVQ